MIFLVGILALFLRLLQLNQSLWLDEAITAVALRNLTLWELITRFAPGDFHPPLYYIVLKLWTNVFGYSEVSLRFPSVIFSVLTVFAVYVMGKTLWNKRAGLIAAFLWAINPLALYYGQEARMYSLETLLVSLSILAFIQKKNLSFIIFFTLALYTDYLPGLLIPVFLIATREKKKEILSRIGVIMLCFAPWLPVLGNQLLTAQQSLSNSPLWASVLGSFELKALPLTFTKFIIGRITIDNKYLYGGTMVVLGGLHAFILSHSRSRLVWLWLVVPVILGLIVSIKIPIYSYFRFLFVLPAFSLLLTDGVRKSKILFLSVFLVSLVSCGVLLTKPRFQREDWKTAAAFINSQSGEVLMPSTAQAAPLYYYNVGWPVRDDTRPPNNPRVYLLRYVQEIFDPMDKLRGALEMGGYQKVSEHNFNGVIIWVYETIN